MAPLPRFHRLAKPRQQTLLDAAEVEFGDHGFDDASFNRIIAAAGVSKGAMYYYFADKADLFTAVVRRAMAAYNARVGELGPVTTAADFWSAFEALLERAAEAALVDPNLTQLLRDLHAGKGGADALALEDELITWMANVLEAGQRVHAVRTDLPLELLARVAMSVTDALERWVIAGHARPKTAHTLLHDLLTPKPGDA